MKPTPLHTPAADAQADIVAVLKEALARAEQGEFASVIVWAGVRGSKDYWCTWNSPIERMEVIAHLERAKFVMLTELETGVSR